MIKRCYNLRRLFCSINIRDKLLTPNFDFNNISQLSIENELKKYTYNSTYFLNYFKLLHSQNCKLINSSYFENEVIRMVHNIKNAEKKDILVIKYFYLVNKNNTVFWNKFISKFIKENEKKNILCINLLKLFFSFEEKLLYDVLFSSINYLLDKYADDSNMGNDIMEILNSYHGYVLRYKTKEKLYLNVLNAIKIDFSDVTELLIFNILFVQKKHQIVSYLEHLKVETLKIKYFNIFYNYLKNNDIKFDINPEVLLDNCIELTQDFNKININTLIVFAYNLKDINVDLNNEIYNSIIYYIDNYKSKIAVNSLILLLELSADIKFDNLLTIINNSIDNTTNNYIFFINLLNYLENNNKISEINNYLKHFDNIEFNNNKQIIYLISYIEVLIDNYQISSLNEFKNNLIKRINNN